MEHNSTISAVLTDKDSTITAINQEMEHIGLLSIDPGLEPHKDHFKYRLTRYLDQKKLIDKYEGGLEEFARGDYSCRQCHLFSFLFSPQN